MKTIKKTDQVFKVDRYDKSVSLLEAHPVRKKKKRPRAESIEPLQIKTSTSKDVALVNTSKKQVRTLANMGKLNAAVGKLTSVFGIKEREIMDAVEAGDIDQAVQVFQRQAYSTIVRLIPIAEKEYLLGKRDHQLYALNSVISQGRELANDLMSSDNKKQLGETIIREILEPAFKQILQQMMQEQMMLKTALSDKLKPEFLTASSGELDSSLRRVAGSMTEIFKSSSEQINKKLLGD
jgi:hypothetical protein